MMIPIVLAAGLAGCANAPGTTPAPSVSSVINAVIAGAQQACQVSPVAADVALLVPIYGAQAATIITAICRAVNAQPMTTAVNPLFGAPVHPPVVVHGVTVHFQ
jgi:hypothetical protein